MQQTPTKGPDIDYFNTASYRRKVKVRALWNLFQPLLVITAIVTVCLSPAALVGFFTAPYYGTKGYAQLFVNSLAVVYVSILVLVWLGVQAVKKFNRFMKAYAEEQEAILFMDKQRREGRVR
jgi:RsiW-degrading membrane proteinase PrsW (M82 family)